MEGATPTNAELIALIAMLQVQVAALTAVTPVAATAPPTRAAPVISANTPQKLGANDLINYLPKRGSAIFEQGCRALNNKTLTHSFAMTPNQTVILVETFHCRATTMGWNQDTKQITTSSTAPDAQSTSSRAMARLTRPFSKLHVRDFASLGSLMPRLAQSRKHDDEY
jgi:hypothetical protein